MSEKIRFQMRISPDTDAKIKESMPLTNCQSKNEIVGESFDDNVSGMHFNREGISKIYKVVDASLIEAVIVKDLSRWIATGRRLNEETQKTPAQLQMELLRKRQPNTHDSIRKKNIWDFTTVSRILRDESYIGTLICHKGERSKINKTFRFTEPEEQFRHENFFPPIVSKDVWQEVQSLLAQRKEVNVRAGEERPILRYSGLLRCDDCGRAFVGKRVKLKERERVEYICDTYLRYGKEHCSSHVIREELLDRLIMEEPKSTKRLYEQNWNDLQKMLDHWMPQRMQTVEQLRSQPAAAGGEDLHHRAGWEAECRYPPQGALPDARMYIRRWRGHRVVERMEL